MEGGWGGGGGGAANEKGHTQPEHMAEWLNKQ